MLHMNPFFPVGRKYVANRVKKSVEPIVSKLENEERSERTILERLVSSDKALMIKMQDWPCTHRYPAD